MNAIAERKENAVETMPAASEAGSLMEVISRAANDPNTDVDKLDRLLGMYERITAREAQIAYDIAMTEAQAEMEPVHKDADNSQTSSKYASHSALDIAIRPIYTRHGFSISYDTGDGAPAEHVRVLANVAHRTGHRKTHQLDVPADGKGAKGGAVMTKTHAAGSALTYGKRYLLQMIFNVVVGGDDDDGNAASDALPRITEAQVKELLALADDVGADLIKFCRYYKIDSLADIKAKDFDAAKKALEAKRVTA
jgi:hypothetical protein